MLTRSQAVILIRFTAGCAIGFAIFGAMTWELKRTAALSIVSGAFVAILGGIIFGPDMWALFGGAMLGGIGVGVLSILATGSNGGAFTGAVIGIPSGGLVGYLLWRGLELRFERNDTMRD